MSLPNPSKGWRSSSSRLLALYSFLFVAWSCILMGVLYYEVSDYLGNLAKHSLMQRQHLFSRFQGEQLDEALATVRGVPNEPGMAAKVFTELATAGVNVDMIVQAGASVGTADISFTVPESAVKQVQNTLLDKQEVLGYHSFDVDTNVGKVAVVGVGMKTHAGLAAKFFQALSDEGINVLMISTSEIRIAALVPLDQLNDAVKALHTAYGLDADQIEAVVYGGTGR